MKMYTTVFALVVMMLTAVAQEKHAPAKEGEHHEACEGSTVGVEEFQKLVEQYIAAYNKNDAKVLGAMYAEDAEYISSHVAGLVASGRTAVVANHQKGIQLGGRLDAVEILSINTSCKVVTLVCKYRATNAGNKAEGRTLLVLKKVDDKWLIVTHMTVV